MFPGSLVHCAKCLEVPDTDHAWADRHMLCWAAAVTSHRVASAYDLPVTCTDSGRYVLWCSFHALVELDIRNYKRHVTSHYVTANPFPNTYWSKIGYLLRKYEACAVHLAGTRKYLGLRCNMRWRFEDTDDHKTAFVMDWEVPGSNVGRRAAVVCILPFSQTLRYDGQLRHC